MKKKTKKNIVKDIIHTYRFDNDCQDSSEILKSLYTEDIHNHFRRIFPGRQTGFHREIVTEFFKLDVHIMNPLVDSDDDNFYVLYTTGLSTQPMNVPKGAQEYAKGELMIFLPPDWDLNGQHTNDNQWPVKIMQKLAGIPHKFNTWIGHGHIIPNGAEYEPYASGTMLSSVLLLDIGEEFSKISTASGDVIYSYMMMPLFKEETEFKLEYGLDALINRIAALGRQNPFIVDTCRENTSILP